MQHIKWLTSLRLLLSSCVFLFKILTLKPGCLKIVRSSDFKSRPGVEEADHGQIKKALLPTLIV